VQKWLHCVEERLLEKEGRASLFFMGDSAENAASFQYTFFLEEAKRFSGEDSTVFRNVFKHICDFTPL
jgi:hypothetical protein